MTNHTPSFERVGIHASFFKNERNRLYSSWQIAFWRELFQNATDALSSKISIKIKRDGNGCRVVFTDNGSGMNEEVLRNVYFNVGATTKNDASSVGGFGRARILTCFSMKRYNIFTQDNIVEGIGGEFRIRKVQRSFNGCLLSIWCDESLERMEKALFSYLEQSQLYCKVQISSETFKGIWKNWLLKNRNVRSFSWGEIYANKSSNIKNALVVRVRGAMMFTRYIDANALVVVEINPDQSREVLLANRDSLHSKANSELDRFLGELAADTRSALKDRVHKKTVHVSGSRGALRTRNRNKPVVKANEVVANSINEAAIRSLVTQDRVDKALRLDDVQKEFAEIKVGQSICPDLFDVYIDDDLSSDSKLTGIIDQYNPINWIYQESKGRRYRKGFDILKLMMIWKAACEAAIEAMYSSDICAFEFSYSFGWVFSDGDNANGARHKKINDVSFFLLNPINSEGLMRYSISKKPDLKKIMALAKHEVAHVLVSYHNEDFAAVLTTIDAYYDEKEVFATIKRTLEEMNG